MSSAGRTEMDFDGVLAHVGHFGPYQLTMYILLCLPASLPSAWTAFNQVFVAAVPNHHCRVPPQPGDDGELAHLAHLERYVPTVPGPENVTRFDSCLEYQNAPIDDASARPHAATVPCRDGWVRSSVHPRIQFMHALSCSGTTTAPTTARS